MCIVRRGDRKIIIPDHQCEEEMKPDTSQNCDNEPCDGLQWITSQWSGVSTADANVTVRTVLIVFVLLIRNLLAIRRNIALVESVAPKCLAL